MIKRLVPALASLAILAAAALPAPAPASAAAPAGASRRDTAAELDRLRPSRALRKLVVRGDPQVGAEARQARFEAALAAYGRASAEALAAWPGEPNGAYHRGQYLAMAGREQEALAMYAPFLADVAATVRRDEHWGVWVVNDAAFLLLTVGREQEAVDLMNRLLEVNYRRAPQLLGPAINFASLLFQAKRPAEALAHIAAIIRPARRGASDAGWMWLAANQVCALKSLARNEPAAELLETMHRRRWDSETAMMRALLCGGDLAAAEAFLVERLEGREPFYALFDLQDYRPGGAATGFEGVLVQRLLILRERPRVKAAIAKAGLILKLPVVRTWF